MIFSRLVIILKFYLYCLIVLKTKKKQKILYLHSLFQLNISIIILLQIEKKTKLNNKKNIQYTTL